MKKYLLIILFTLCCLIGCAPKNDDLKEVNDNNKIYYQISDEEFLDDFESNIYDDILDELDSDEYYVQNVSTLYYSKEYLEEITYNSQSNIYFGYTLEELEGVFEDDKYVFTLGDNGETIVKAFEAYDETYDTILKNVLVGSGVILVCVTVSAVTGPAAPAVSLIFAGSAKTAAIMGLSSGGIAALTAGIITGVESKDCKEALKQAALAGSESFKWGAITGAIQGGLSTGVGLKGATENGLTMNEAAKIQKESKLPLSYIKSFHSVDEYNVYKEAGLKAIKINGSWAYTQDIDWELKDSLGRTNYQRVSKGLSPIDKNGIPFELHHIGQKDNSPLAILTKEQHRSTETFDKLHKNTGTCTTEIDHNNFKKIKTEFWLKFRDLTYKGK